MGCDAKVALDIHNMREENPDKFYSQVKLSLNKRAVTSSRKGLCFWFFFPVLEQNPLR